MPLTFRNNIARHPESGKYVVRKMVRGHVVQRSFPTRRAALLFLEALSLEAVGLRIEHHGTTIREAERAYQSRLAELGRGDYTQEYYRAKITRVAEVIGWNYPVESLDQVEIDRYVAARKAAVGPGSIIKE